MIRHQPRASPPARTGLLGLSCAVLLGACSTGPDITPTPAGSLFSTQLSVSDADPPSDGVALSATDHCSFRPEWAPHPGAFEIEIERTTTRMNSGSTLRSISASVVSTDCVVGGGLGSPPHAVPIAGLNLEMATVTIDFRCSAMGGSTWLTVESTGRLYGPDLICTPQRWGADE